MSAERSLSPTGRRAALGVALGILTVAAAAAGYTSGRNAAALEVMAAYPSEARKVAFVRDERCATGRCHTLWIGDTHEDAKQVGALDGDERVEGIAWAKDGYRMGFIVNGYQLRIFDGMTGEFISQLNLIEPQGVPSSRIVRGVTFSENGASVTFDDCPRYSSGCKSGLAAVRR